MGSHYDNLYSRREIQTNDASQLPHNNYGETMIKNQKEIEDKLVEQQSAIDQSAIEKCLLDGDLKDLNPDQRLSYYKQVCETVGLNPLTKPFQYITLNGKLQMYALKGATDQLRKIHNINCKITNRENIEDIHTVTIEVKDRHGRIDEDIGFAKIAGLKGDMLGNALSKAVTKAKRRATLSICGLGMLDETEIASIPDDNGSGKGKKEFDTKSDQLMNKISEVKDEYEDNKPQEIKLDESVKTTLKNVVKELNEKFATFEGNLINNDIVDALREKEHDVEYLTEFAKQYIENKEIIQDHINNNQDKWKIALPAKDWNNLIQHITTLMSYFNSAVENKAA